MLFMPAPEFIIPCPYPQQVSPHTGCTSMICPATDSPAPNAHPPCGLVRRLAAMTYDGLLLFAVLFMATLAVLPLTGGDAIPSGNSPYASYLLLITYFYFAGQWVHGGRTLGMRAWRIRLLKRDGGAPGWSACSVRFAAALLCWAPAAGLGFLSGVCRPDRLAWHDRLSGTWLQIEPRETRS